ncbi:unnamed protein product [Acanthosepion pharaonis]|uniref:Uncharacterized protein n=1 Tax=Acanthosepion pharaonis TaxID=158019 RepID=A0A812B7F3_ACAPH|nr:unnamed protein product [Sepia pharaonis]
MSNVRTDANSILLVALLSMASWLLVSFVSVFPAGTGGDVGYDRGGDGGRARVVAIDSVINGCEQQRAKLPNNSLDFFFDITDGKVSSIFYIWAGGRVIFVIPFSTRVVVRYFILFFFHFLSLTFFIYSFSFFLFSFFLSFLLFFPFYLCFDIFFLKFLYLIRFLFRFILFLSFFLSFIFLQSSIFFFY